MAMGCQKTCGGRFLHIKIFLATLYIMKCLLAFDEHVHLPCNSQSNTLPLDKKETPSIVLLSFASSSYILL